MRAAFIEQPGGAIRLGRLPVPCPGPTDVLVRVQASGVNHVDLFVRSGAYRTPMPRPFVLGRDLVGSVAGLGAGVSGFAVGERVWCNSLGHAGRQGALAEYAVVAADRLYPLPAQADAQQAVAMLHTAATAHIGLVREARLQAGETLLVEGAGGGVGSAVVQLARCMGARVIATASARDAAWCRQCGADVVLDYRTADLYQQVSQAAPEGIDLWWDNSGRHDFLAVLPLMRLGGRVLVMSGLGGASASLPVGQLYTRDVSLHGFAISNASAADLARAAAAMNRLFAAGRLQARIGATFHLADVAQAYAAVQAGGVNGRIVVLVE
ncbi:MAG: NADPH:quinone reductase [Proteobacteria bacterium]|nr:NADPH:quinone reductase [Pseudomonadota bacterium]